MLVDISPLVQRATGKPLPQASKPHAKPANRLTEPPPLLIAITTCFGYTDALQCCACRIRPPSGPQRHGIFGQIYEDEA